MWRLKSTSIFLSCLVAGSPTIVQAAAPCDLSPVTSSLVISDSVDIGGAKVAYQAHPSWLFANQDDLVRLTEKVDVELPNVGPILLAKAIKQAGFPDSDCDVTSSVTGQSAAARSPALVLHVDFSGTKWACPGATVPCPTLSQPFRTCYKRLAKTILAKGHGSFETALTPAFADDDINISTASKQDFHIDQGSGLAIGLGLALGQMGPVFAALLPKINLLGGISFHYPDITIPANLLAAGEANSPVAFNWQNSKVYFSNYGSSISLVRERYTDLRPATACYLKSVLGSTH
jgi:hypothetical protein